MLEGQAAADALEALLSSKGVRLALEALVLSPLFGLAGGFLLMVLLLWYALCCRSTGDPEPDPPRSLLYTVLSRAGCGARNDYVRCYAFDLRHRSASRRCASPWSPSTS